MATKRLYGYYVKGNKFAIVERDLSTTTSDLNTEDVGKFKSPTADASQGIELQYAYSPTFWIDTSIGAGENIFPCNGWIVIDGYVAFARSHNERANVADWTSSPYNRAYLNEYIYVQGGRWAGLHIVQEGNADGWLKTYTKTNIPEKSHALTNGFDIAEESGGKFKVTTNGDSDVFLASTYKAGDYVFFVGSTGTTYHEGFYEVDSVNQSGEGETLSEIYIKNRHWYPAVGDLTTAEGSYFDVEQITTSLYNNGSAGSAASNTTMAIYEAFHEPCKVIANVNVMEDEDFDLDLPRYLANAVVYYVKAKILEDAGEFEKKEYFMREFKRQVEKHQSTRKKGSYRALGFMRSI